MKAILCMDNTIHEIENWFNFEECRKFMLGIPKKSAIVVDEKLFLSMKKLGLDKNFEMVVFGEKNNFESATNCKNFESLSKKILSCEKNKQKVFVLSGSQIFDKLLPYCSMTTVGKFDKSVKKSPIASMPIGNRWVLLATKSKFISKEILYYVNINKISPIFLSLQDKFMEEDRLNGYEPQNGEINATIASLTKTTNKETQQELTKEVLKDPDASTLLSKVLNSKQVGDYQKQSSKRVQKKAKSTPSKTNEDIAESIMTCTANKPTPKVKAEASQKILKDTKIFDFAKGEN